MTKPKIKTYYARPVTVGEVNTKPSKTQPDQSMSIREIINRSSKGLPVSGIRVPIYNETEDGIMPDLRNMDLSEIHDLKQRLAKKQQDIRKELQEEEEKRQQEEAEAYYKRKFAAPSEPPKPDPEDPKH